MTREISQRELRNDSGRIMRALEKGEDFVVTRNGTPIGELRPVRRTWIPREQLLQAFAGAPPIDPDRFRADLDRHASQDIEPRA